MVSYGFHHFPMVFLWFAYGFHQFGVPSEVVAPAQLAKGHLSSEMPGRQYVLVGAAARLRLLVQPTIYFPWVI